MTAPAPTAMPDAAQAPDPAPEAVASPQPVRDASKPDGLPDDPEQLKAEIARLRRENGTERTNAKARAAEEARDAVLQEIGKTLGFIKDGDAAPDLTKLTEQLTGTQDENRTLKVENAVWRSASKHGADANALTDSRSFLAALSKLDPASDTFGTDVDAAIQTAVQQNPKLKAGRVPGASGADHTGGSGEPYDPAAKARPGVNRLEAAYASTT